MEIEDFPGVEEALQSYIAMVRDQLSALCRLKEFRHVSFQETDEPLQVRSRGTIQ